MGNDENLSSSTKPSSDSSLAFEIALQQSASEDKTVILAMVDDGMFIIVHNRVMLFKIG